MQCALSKADAEPEPEAKGGTVAYEPPGTAPALAQLAALFPQMEILELIGQGGMGAVYKARQIKLDRLVAVKILPAEWGRDPAFAERFAREARALARLNHAHIVGVHDFGEAGGLFYLVMEYVDGVNLRHLLQGGRLQPQQALALVPQICAALHYAHEQGVVHRDIKPENILVDRRGAVKIADFGLAKLTRRSAAEFTLTGSQQVMGTLDYMAPEQRATPQEVDHRADIYSLGVVFYEMLTGALPLGRFAAPSQMAGVDGRLDDVVFRALEREPDRRYQRISEVQADVESIAHGIPAALAVRAAPAHHTSDGVPLVVTFASAGLFLTGIVFAVQAFVVAVMIYFHAPNMFPPKSGFPGDVLASDPDVFDMGFAGVALVACAISLTLLGGGYKMARQENYGFVLIAAILAMVPVPYHCIVGGFAGLLAVLVLCRKPVRAAFALNAQNLPPARSLLGSVKSAVGSMLTMIVHRPTAQGNRTAVTPSSSRSRSWGLLPNAVVLLLTVGVGLLAWSFVDCVRLGLMPSRNIGPGAGSVRNDVAGFPPSLGPVNRSLDFHRGRMWNVMDVNSAASVQEIFRSADDEYLKIEARHTTALAITDGVAVTVHPFVEELKVLEERVWAQLEAVLSEPQMAKTRKLLPIRGSLFPYGKDTVTIQLKYVRSGFGDDWYWRETKTGDLDNVQWGKREGSLPVEYRRFWNKWGGHIAFTPKG
jgi:tRNA A-37 threonylcarbamoyl transferase component Bud32